MRAVARRRRFRAGPAARDSFPEAGWSPWLKATMEAAMRKIIESTLVSADGVIGDPPRWAMEYRDAEVTAEALERLASAEAMLMGRGTYELFSATLDEAAWNNSVILRGDTVAEVTRLKQQDCGELALYGHGRLAQALLE